jgi:hypothetical protein
MRIEHTWAPRDRLIEILQEAVGTAKSLAEFAAAVALLTA